MIRVSLVSMNSGMRGRYLSYKTIISIIIIWSQCFSFKLEHIIYAYAEVCAMLYFLIEIKYNTDQKRALDGYVHSILNYQ